MRMMLTLEMEVEVSNRLIRDGSIQNIIQNLIMAIKPESTYFFAENGKRSAQFVFDMKDSAQIPQLTEPLFAAFNAKVDLKPVMNIEELRRGLDAAAAAQQKTKRQPEMA